MAVTAECERCKALEAEVQRLRRMLGSVVGELKTIATYAHTDVTHYLRAADARIAAETMRELKKPRKRKKKA